MVGGWVCTHPHIYTRTYTHTVADTHKPLHTHPKAIKETSWAGPIAFLVRDLINLRSGDL